MRRMGSILVFTLVLAMAGSALAAIDYAFISPDKLKANMDSGEEMVIVDICEPEMFEKGHIKGSLATNAYPVKSEQDTAKLEKLLPVIEGMKSDIVIVCPRGKGGAKRTYDYYKNMGVDQGRLKILSGGLAGWPYDKVTD